MLGSEKLESWLGDMGWTATRRDARTLVCRHDTSEGKIAVYVRLLDNWLVASVVPFLPTKNDVSFELLRWLLRQNRDMNQSKFALDEDGDVVLTAELPTESIDPSEAQGALAELLDQAVRHRRTLRIASGA